MKSSTLGWQSWSSNYSFWTRYLKWGSAPVIQHKTRKINVIDGGKLKRKIRYWCSWYAFGQDISHEKIMKVIDIIGMHNLKISHVIVDDGWTRWGDWHTPDINKFPNMKSTVENISKASLRSGLWFAPFLASKRSLLYKLHPNWFIRHRGKLVNGVNVHPTIDWLLPKKYLLDFSLVKVRKYMTSFIDLAVVKWKVKLLKIDFLYAIYFDPRYKNDQKAHNTIKWLLTYIKKTYPKVIVVASAAPYSPTVGIADVIRIHLDNVFPPIVPSIINKFVYRYQIDCLRYKLSKIILPKSMATDPDVRMIDFDNRVTENFWSQVDKQVLGVGDDLLKLSREKILKLKEWLKLSK